MHSARQAIRKHNGDISVINSPFKEGVKFTVWIPVDGKKSEYSYDFSGDDAQDEEDTPELLVLEVSDLVDEVSSDEDEIKITEDEVETDQE